MSICQYAQPIFFIWQDAFNTIDTLVTKTPFNKEVNSTVGLELFQSIDKLINLTKTSSFLLVSRIQIDAYRVGHN